MRNSMKQGRVQEDNVVVRSESWPTWKAVCLLEAGENDPRGGQLSQVSYFLGSPSK